MLLRRSLLSGVASLAASSQALGQPFNACLGPVAGRMPAGHPSCAGPQATADLPPSLDLNFLSGTLDPRITFSRAAGVATYFDINGILANTPTNYVRNNTMIGAVVGTPGTLPTNWSQTGTASGAFVAQVIGTGIEKGINYIDVRFANTYVSGGVSMVFEAINAIAAQAGQSWAYSTYLKLVGGSFANVSSILIGWTCVNAGLTNVAGAARNTPPLTITAAPLDTQRAVVAPTDVLLPTTAWIRPQIVYNLLPGPVDFTIRIGMPQMEIGTAASAPIATSGTAQAGANYPRFDYDPMTHAARGLLIEEARTNFALQSGAMHLAPWAAQRAIATGNAILAPDGTTTATLVTEDNTTANSHYHGSVVAGIAVNAPISFSVYLRNNTRRYARIQLFDNTTPANTYQADVDLTAGTLVFGVSGGAISGGSFAISSAGGGWFRCSIAVTLSATATTGIIARVTLCNTLGNTIYDGGGVSSLYMWGAQVEAGTFATSHIPTTGASATRAADVATMPVGAWFNAAASSLAADYIVDQATNASANHRDAAAISDGTFNNRLILRGQASSSAQIQIVAAVANVSTSSASLATAVASTRMRVAGAWNGTNMVGSANGGAVLSAAKGLPAGLTTLALGNDYAGGSQNLDGWISRVRYWPRALSAAELQRATT